jgi:chromosome segregation ATPase
MNMIRTWPAILLAASIATLSGCVQQPAVVETPASSQPAPQVVVVRAENEILAYALRYSALPAEDQRKEYAQVMQAYNHNKESLSNRIRAALVMALPGSRQRDNAKALALLDEIQREQSADQDARAIAALLREYVAERQKLEENTAKLTQKVTDEQKRIELLQGKADALQIRADTLQQKLDELKNIEKTLNTRGVGKQK